MSDEVRLSCRCFAVPRDEGDGYLVVGAAFLCPNAHHSGDMVTHDDERALAEERK